MTADPVVVSVLVPVLDEADWIDRALAAMSAQTQEGVELLFIDGGSTDGTRERLAELADASGAIRLFDNPARRVPQALNIGLEAARGEFVARMDAHTVYPPEYLAAGVERLRRGGVDWVSGPQLAVGDDQWSRAVALALNTPLGVGGAQFRSPISKEIETDTGFTGILRRSTLEELGGWDEDWPVNQDGELAARVRERGGRIVCIPEMAASYAPRNSLRALARQYRAYGQFRVKTSRAHPESMRPSHLLPPALVGAFAAAALGRGRLRALGRGAAGAYAAVLAGESLRQAAAGRDEDALRLPAVLATMHVAWGLGFLYGCARFGPPAGAVLHVARGKR